jgi:hypothetical protein
MYDTPIYVPEELPEVRALCDTLAADGATIDQACAAAGHQDDVSRSIVEHGESHSTQ